MSDIFYFGCIHHTGHFMYNTHGRSVHDVGDMPWGSYGQDGKLPPQEGPQIEGQAMLRHKAGWTALSFWDRSLDTRNGCNSNFFLRGTYDFAEAVALARTAFPKVWARFTFDVVPFKGDNNFKEKADRILADHAQAEKLRAIIKDGLDAAVGPPDDTAANNRFIFQARNVLQHEPRDCAHEWVNLLGHIDSEGVWCHCCNATRNL